MSKGLEKSNEVDQVGKMWLKRGIGFCSAFMIFVEKCKLCVRYVVIELPKQIRRKKSFLREH